MKKFLKPALLSAFITISFTASSQTLKRDIFGSVVGGHDIYLLKFGKK